MERLERYSLLEIAFETKDHSHVWPRLCSIFRSQGIGDSVVSSLATEYFL
jgi:hypothetical protein